MLVVRKLLVPLARFPLVRNLFAGCGTAAKYYLGTGWNSWMDQYLSHYVDSRQRQ